MSKVFCYLKVKKKEICRGKVQIKEGSAEGFSLALANLSQRKACIRNSAVLKDLALFWDLII